VARNAVEWGQTPPLPATHYVDPLIYSSAEILAEEREKIFARTWVIACHESELPARYDYRTYRHPADKNLVVVRGDDDVIRSFYNVCPHRGNTIVYEPAGNAKHLLCIFHTFSFDCRGDCVGIPRENAGYGDRLSKRDFGLRAVRTEVGFGGFVYVNLDDDARPLSEFIGGALDDLLPSLETEPLEVFSFHRAIVATNYKLWHDTNSEFYHDYMHYHNRQTSMAQPGYFERRYTAFPNGHARVGDQVVNYAAYAGFKSRDLSFPGMVLNGWKMVDLFPGMTYNLRGSSLRIDTLVPLSPAQTAIEFRGLGLKRDTPQKRASRVHDYNTIWGPFGRNLHEDLLGVLGQGRALGRGQTYFVHGREEDATIHDEIGMRHFYAEWSRRMVRSSSDPFGDRRTPAVGAVDLEEVLV
jgi:methanesulfonate monooxygenase large subunit